MIFHIEVHSRDRQVEHYIVPNVQDDIDAIKRVVDYYRENGQEVGFWDNETHRTDPKINYLIFQTRALSDEPVIYIAGEYRTQYPI